MIEMAGLERRAEEILASYERGDAGKLREGIQQMLGKAADARLTLDEARHFVARVHHFDSWQSLAAALGQGPMELERPAKLFTEEERTVLTARGWDEAALLLTERKIPGLHAEGQMTDEALETISRTGHLTSLNLEGSRGLTDAGLRHLARLPGLQSLNLNGCPITDAGLAVLRDLPHLRSVQLAHQSRITDGGVAHLAHCRQLERVELLGSSTGDGALKALAGMPGLRHFTAGRHVTAEGTKLLHELPVFKSWQGGEVKLSLLSPASRPNFLGLHWLEQRLPAEGLANLAGLDGLFGLSIDAEPSGLSHLAQLPNLGMLGFDGKHCTDAAMRTIATLPRLRFLMCQDTVAGDEGFTALSASRTIEYIWGRRCHNLGSQGFIALSGMPALCALSASCKNVGDDGIAALPDFPALKELMPMDVPDDGYRHIGRCSGLESLVLMYCRETGDTATSHIAGLPNLKKYFVSYNKITNRSLEILGKMESLEDVEFSACAGITNAGVAALARLPRLRRIGLGGLQGVTSDAVKLFPPNLSVDYSF